MIEVALDEFITIGKDCFLVFGTALKQVQIYQQMKLWRVYSCVGQFASRTARSHDARELQQQKNDDDTRKSIGDGGG